MWVETPDIMAMTDLPILVLSEAYRIQRSIYASPTTGSRI
jgi:hypothetical protein